jgi:hypothetical protein
MSKKITNNVEKNQEVIEVETIETEQTEKSPEPETTEVTNEEKVPFYMKKPFKVIAAVGAGLGGAIVVGVKVISSFGKKQWNEGYEEGWHDGQDTSGPSEEETSEDAQEYEYPEDDE